jgi:hypothetical protein
VVHLNVSFNNCNKGKLWMYRRGSCHQCCGSGSRIWCLFWPPWIQDPRYLKNQDPDPVFRMNIPDHISESLHNFWGWKYLNLWCRSGSRIRNLFDPGSRIRVWKIQIREPGWTSRICNTGFHYSTFEDTVHCSVPQDSACSRWKRGEESLTRRLLGFLSPPERGPAPEPGRSWES